MKSETVISPMFLVYVDENGERHFQPWQDVGEVGALIDPESGEDMELIGWCVEK